MARVLPAPSPWTRAYATAPPSHTRADRAECARPRRRAGSLECGRRRKAADAAAADVSSAAADADIDSLRDGAREGDGRERGWGNKGELRGGGVKAVEVVRERREERK